MPIYEYECEAGHRFERYGALGGEQSPTCPHCGRPARRVPALVNLKKNAGIWIFDRRTGRDILHDR